MMKRCNVLLILLLSSVMGFATLYESPVFRIPHESAFELSKEYSNIIISCDTILLLDYINPISGLAISGKTMLEDKDAMIRVLLTDKEGKEYLVFDDSYMFPDDNEHIFSDMAMETVVLENIIPTEIRIFVRDAKIQISQITGVPAEKKLSSQAIAEKRKNIHSVQEEYLIDRWNRANAQTGQYWIAGKTSISGLSYSEKKILLGAIDDHFLSDGIEYYAGGFFVIKSHGNTKDNSQDDFQEIREANSYVESFDWRNRHGKNWMTSVKHQEQPYNNISGNGGCWIFGSIAALESRIKLYYNRQLNIDLAEQEIGSCLIGNPYPSLHMGGNPYDAYNYILSHGVVNEECFPFQNDSTIPCEEKCASPQYIANISGHSSASSGTNQLKYELINNGPIESGIYNDSGKIAHVMCLCGYGDIMAGMPLEYVLHTSGSFVDTIVPANSNLIGKTYWIYKNSYGLGWGVNGYLYAVFERDADRAFTRSLSYPVTVSTLTTDDIVCEDADNDGYYFWGLGPKPNNCPICCPDTPDGDDSNPLLAEMDNYGNFADYVFPYPTTTISNDATWDTDITHCGNIIVTNSATLTITATLTMNPAAKIIVENGGTLIVDAGVINNAIIDVLSSASIQLLHNGTLYLKQHGNLNVRLGAEADMEYGRVLLQ